MISMSKNRIETQVQPDQQALDQTRVTSDQAKQLGGEIVAQVKKLAIEKPVVVVAAGLAIGVLTGLILKRK